MCVNEIQKTIPISAINLPIQVCTSVAEKYRQRVLQWKPIHGFLPWKPIHRLLPWKPIHVRVVTMETHAWAVTMESKDSHCNSAPYYDSEKSFS